MDYNNLPLDLGLAIATVRRWTVLWICRMARRKSSLSATAG